MMNANPSVVIIRRHHQLRLRRPLSLILIRNSASSSKPDASTPPSLSNTQTTQTTTTAPTTLLSAYSQLSKAKLSALVVSTTAAGYIASGGACATPAFAELLTGTFLCSASAAAYNQIYERQYDAQMLRTRLRPTATGKISPSHGLAVATVWGVSGVGLLSDLPGTTTALLGALNIGLYAGVYTPLKQYSIWNTWVGAIVGAIPPVMGCTAVATSSLVDGPAVSLALLLYHWQLVHFLALSHMYRVDYARGGFRMLGVVDTVATAASIERNAVGLTVVPPMIAYATGATSAMFVVESVVLNSYVLYLCRQFRQESSNQNARRLFMSSLWYLPCSLILFCWHSQGMLRETDEEKEQQTLMHSLRDWGRRHCLHEQNAVHETCPITHDVPSAAIDAAKDTATTVVEQQRQLQQRSTASRTT